MHIHTQLTILLSDLTKSDQFLHDSVFVFQRSRTPPYSTATQYPSLKSHELESTLSETAAMQSFNLALFALLASAITVSFLPQPPGEPPTIRYEKKPTTHPLLLARPLPYPETPSRESATPSTTAASTTSRGARTKASGTTTATEKRGKARCAAISGPTRGRSRVAMARIVVRSLRAGAVRATTIHLSRRLRLRALHMRLRRRLLVPGKGGWKERGDSPSSSFGNVGERGIGVTHLDDCMKV